MFNWRRRKDQLLGIFQEYSEKDGENLKKKPILAVISSSSSSSFQSA